MGMGLWILSLLQVFNVVTILIILNSCSYYVINSCAFNALIVAAQVFLMSRYKECRRVNVSEIF
jgi:hypothetical protein